MSIMHERFQLKYIAMTFRDQLAVNRHNLKALLYDGKDFYQSDAMEVEIVDRVGTGDAFSTGLVYSLVNDFEGQKAVDFATGCFALKHTVEGDVSVLSLQEVEQFVQNRNSFAIRR